MHVCVCMRVFWFHKFPNAVISVRTWKFFYKTFYVNYIKKNDNQEIKKISNFLLCQSIMLCSGGPHFIDSFREEWKPEFGTREWEWHGNLLHVCINYFRYLQEQTNTQPHSFHSLVPSNTPSKRLQQGWGSYQLLCCYPFSVEMTSAMWTHAPFSKTEFTSYSRNWTNGIVFVSQTP